MTCIAQNEPSADAVATILPLEVLIVSVFPKSELTVAGKVKGKQERTGLLFKRLAAAGTLADFLWLHYPCCHLFIW